MNKKKSKYRRPLLFAGLLFAVSTIRGLFFCAQNFVSAGFPSIIRGFTCILSQKTRHFCPNSAPLLSAVLVFAGVFKNVAPANNRAACTVKPEWTTTCQHRPLFGKSEVGHIFFIFYWQTDSTWIILSHYRTLWWWRVK